MPYSDQMEPSNPEFLRWFWCRTQIKQNPIIPTFFVDFDALSRSNRTQLPRPFWYIPYYMSGSTLTTIGSHPKWHSANFSSLDRHPLFLHLFLGWFLRFTQIKQNPITLTFFDISHFIHRPSLPPSTWLVLTQGGPTDSRATVFHTSITQESGYHFRGVHVKDDDR